MRTGKIYLIRHGQTVGNGHHYVGWEDLSLNETGQQQALEIARVLRDEEIETIYCSALNRAIATAQPLAAGKGLSLQADSALNEINYGEYQGRLKSELALKLRKDFRHRRLPGGESLHDVYARVGQFYQSLTKPRAVQHNLAIISHYWSIRMLLGIIQNKAFDDIFSPGDYKPTNGSIFEVTYRFGSLGNLEVLTQHYLKLSPIPNIQLIPGVIK